MRTTIEQYHCTEGEQYAYDIKVEEGNTSWTVTHKYNQFQSLDAELHQKFANNFLPDLPKKPLLAWGEWLPKMATDLAQYLNRLCELVPREDILIKFLLYEYKSEKYPQHRFLIEAVRSSNVERVSEFYEYDGVSLDFDYQGEPFIVEACRYNNIPIIEKILAINPKLVNKAAGSSAKSPLHEACGCGFSSIGIQLLKHNADVNATETTKGWTPLHYLVRCVEPLSPTQLELYKRLFGELLARGANINAQDSAWCTPLHISCVSSNIVLFPLLLNRGANIEQTNTEGKTILHLLAGSVNRKKAPALLLELFTFLFGRITCVDDCIRMRDFLELKDGEGRTAIEHAITANHTETVTIISNNYEKLENKILDYMLSQFLHLAPNTPIVDNNQVMIAQFEDPLRDVLQFVRESVSISAFHNNITKLVAKSTDFITRLFNQLSFLTESSPQANAFIQQHVLGYLYETVHDLFLRKHKLADDVLIQKLNYLSKNSTYQSFGITPEIWNIVAGAEIEIVTSLKTVAVQPTPTAKIVAMQKVFELTLDAGADNNTPLFAYMLVKAAGDLPTAVHWHAELAYIIALMEDGEAHSLLLSQIINFFRSAVIKKDVNGQASVESLDIIVTESIGNIKLLWNDHKKTAQGYANFMLLHELFLQMASNSNQSQQLVLSGRFSDDFLQEYFLQLVFTRLRIVVTNNISTTVVSVTDGTADKFAFGMIEQCFDVLKQ